MGDGEKEENMRVSIVAALVSHSRLLSCKYHTQRLLLAKFLCLVIHIWADRSRTRAPPLLMTPASNRQTHTSSSRSCFSFFWPLFTIITLPYMFYSGGNRVPVYTRLINAINTRKWRDILFSAAFSVPPISPQSSAICGCIYSKPYYYLSNKSASSADPPERVKTRLKTYIFADFSLSCPLKNITNSSLYIFSLL